MFCSTRGEAGTVDLEYMQDFIKQSPTCGPPKLQAPPSVLGLAGVIYLAIGIPGMTGSPDNQNPASLFMAPVEQVAALISKLSGNSSPMSSSHTMPGGGYGHPDHIATTTPWSKAFYAANDQLNYPRPVPVSTGRNCTSASDPRAL